MMQVKAPYRRHPCWSEGKIRPQYCITMRCDLIPTNVGLVYRVAAQAPKPTGFNLGCNECKLARSWESKCTRVSLVQHLDWYRTTMLYPMHLSGVARCMVIHTRGVLQHHNYNVQSGTTCVLCDTRARETRDHLFFFTVILHGPAGHLSALLGKRCWMFMVILL